MIDILCDELIEVVKKRMKNQTETTKVYMDDLIDVLQETRISAHKAERMLFQEYIEGTLSRRFFDKPK